MSRPKNSIQTLTRPLNGPKKSKITPKLSENKSLQLKKTKKIKVVQLHELTPK